MCAVLVVGLWTVASVTFAQEEEGGDGLDGTWMVAGAECGNSIVEPGESCDPPGVPAGQPDECRATCTFCFRDYTRCNQVESADIVIGDQPHETCP